jgi:serine/threonine protein kinase
VSKLRERFKDVKFDKGLDLLERLLEIDPTKRISAKEAYSHPFANSCRSSVDNIITTERTREIK